jgi:hypothetical protein
MRMGWRRVGIVVFLGACSWGQVPKSDPLTIITKKLPPAFLWMPYQPENRNGFRLRAKGGLGTQHWRIVDGLLPGGIRLDDSGLISGTPQETGDFRFAVRVNDDDQFAIQKLVLLIETPLPTEWDSRAHANGQSIEGSVKVSNETGRDADLTFIVLAVDPIGRATAIGYEHFTLKKGTRDFGLSFGNTVGPGFYTVNVDIIGEEPVSQRIFRARLVTGVGTTSGAP